MSECRVLKSIHPLTAIPGPDCDCKSGTCVLFPDRHCPNCGAVRPPTGGGFCNSYCTHEWQKKQEIDSIARGGALYVLHRLAEPYRTWIAEELQRKDTALDTARNALVRLSKTGSLARDVREAAIKAVTEARNERLF